MRKFATYIVAKPGVAPGTMLKPGYCRASFIIGIALAYGHKKSPKNGAFVYKSVYKFCKSLIFKVYCGEKGTGKTTLATSLEAFFLHDVEPPNMGVASVPADERPGVPGGQYAGGVR